MCRCALIFDRMHISVLHCIYCTYVQIFVPICCCILLSVLYKNVYNLLGFGQFTKVIVS